MSDIRYTSLTDQMVDFCRYLRSKGFYVGPGDEEELLQVLDQYLIGDRELFYLSLRALLAKTKEQQDKFPELFRHYWQQSKDGRSQKSNNKKQPSQKPTQKNKEAQFRALKDWINRGKDEKKKTEVKIYSEIGASEQLDLSILSDQEFNHLMRQLQQKVRYQRRKKRLRYRSRLKGSSIDLKQTIESSKVFFGEPIYIYRKKHLPKKHRIFLIGDVSRSMELYTIQLLKFFYVFRQLYDQLHTFLFSTDIEEVTSHFKQRNVREMLEKLQSEVNLWHGGTRTGISLKQFLELKGYSKLDKSSIVIILSDGIDSGNIELLESCLFDIRKRSAKILWLNPLKGNPDYKPESKGMKAALPYISALLPCHSFEAMAAVLDEINK